VAATDRRNDKRPQARTWVAFPRVAARRRGEEARILVARHVVVSQSVIVCLTPAALGGAAFGGLCRSRHPRGVLHRRPHQFAQPSTSIRPRLRRQRGFGRGRVPDIQATSHPKCRSRRSGGSSPTQRSRVAHRAVSSTSRWCREARRFNEAIWHVRMPEVHRHRRLRELGGKVTEQLRKSLVVGALNVSERQSWFVSQAADGLIRDDARRSSGRTTS